MKPQTEIERKLAGRMSLASRAFLWLATLGIVASLAAFAHVQRWFTPTMDLYFYADTATGLNRGMAVKLVGFNVGSLEELNVVGELRVKGKITIDRRYRDSLATDTRIRLTRETVLGNYVLVLLPGQGDGGTVTGGSTLAYERELDYGALAASLVERIGPVLEDIRTATQQITDPKGNVQQALRRLDEALVEVAATAKGVGQLAADGRALVRGVPARIDPLVADARSSVQRVDAVMGDAQRTLARADGMLLRMDDALTPILDDTRRTLQNARAATERLNRTLADDVPVLVKRGTGVLDDADELIGGVRRSWPVSGILPQPARTVIELDSADGADHLTAGGAARR